MERTLSFLLAAGVIGVLLYLFFKAIKVIGVLLYRFVTSFRELKTPTTTPTPGIYAVKGPVATSENAADYELVPTHFGTFDADSEEGEEDEEEMKREHREPVIGSGYYVRRLRDGQRLSWETLPKSDGLEAMPIAGVKYRLAALQSSAVAPGKWLTLVPEPTNPNDPYAVGVWDLNRQQQIGYLPRGEAKGVFSALQKGEALRCFSLWENHTKKERVSLRMLVIGPNAKLRIPT